MTQIFAMRTGRALEVAEYGDPGGHPAFFFHGFVGSHHQASYIADQARRQGLRILAPNRPGVGRSEYVDRRSALEAVEDVEDLAGVLKLEEFSLIGISGGTPYALAALHRLRARVRTTTVISGMGPLRLPGALRGMSRAELVLLALYSRHPGLARRMFRRMTDRFRVHPGRFLDRLVARWAGPDREVFRRPEIRALFLQDLHQVFTEGRAPESLAQVLTLFRHFGFSLRDLPADRLVCLWHGLADTVVPPGMTWAMAQHLPRCEAHFVPGGHFMAVDVADRIISRLRRLLDAPEPASAAAVDG
ncbi:MAG TPA: alpha/beta hydrolase [Isosphaeraceae bacterium]